ncbi:carbon monoxide dehydrogenase subunit G [Acidobacteria bacterium AH-259-O06]|nr:carbon monoxide dehydrogenase subunit G [Acidobacteria bacterium AH-259-O06]
MKVEGRHTFDVPRDVLWKALLDPNVISKTLPGCDELIKLGENEYKGTFSIRIGPVQGKFEGKFTLSNLNPPESYHLKLSGKGVSGFLEGEGDIQLEDHNGSTSLHYEISAQVGGRMAGVGQRLMDSSARLITRQGLEQLHQQINALYQTKDSRDLPQAVGTPPQTQFAANVAKGILADLIPRHRRLMVLGLSLAVLLLFIIFFRACSG